MSTVHRGIKRDHVRLLRRRLRRRMKQIRRETEGQKPNCGGRRIAGAGPKSAVAASRSRSVQSSRQALVTRKADAIAPAPPTHLAVLPERQCPEQPDVAPEQTVAAVPERRAEMPDLSNPDALLTEREAAVVLGVKPKTLANWRGQGKGPAYVKLGRPVRYRAGTLTEWLQAHTRGPN